MKTTTFKGAGAAPFGAGAVKPVKTCHCCLEKFSSSLLSKTAKKVVTKPAIRRQKGEEFSCEGA